MSNTSRRDPRAPRCANSGCIDVNELDAGVVLTSTIEGNDGALIATRDEWVVFVAEVKDGKWDFVGSSAVAGGKSAAFAG